MRAYLISFIFLFACTGKSSDTKTANQEQQKEMKGQKPPFLNNLQFTDLEGHRFSGEKFAGKPVFMNFWATWCGPCVKEMPSIEAAIKQVPEVTFLFPSDEGLSKIQQFKSSTAFKFNFIQLNSEMGKLNIYSLPTTFLVDKEGKVVETIIGAKDWSSEESITLLKELVQM